MKIIIGFLTVLIVAVIGFVGFNILSNSDTNQEERSETSTSSSATSSADTNNETTTVTLSKDGFSPQTVTIAEGEIVVWMNESGREATVNSDRHPTHRNYTPLNLDQFSPGESLSLVFNEPGTYTYHNHLNPSQTGAVIVE
jgi:plastocyanin